MVAHILGQLILVSFAEASAKPHCLPEPFSRGSHPRSVDPEPINRGASCRRDVANRILMTRKSKPYSRINGGDKRAAEPEPISRGANARRGIDRINGTGGKERGPAGH